MRGLNVWTWFVVVMVNLSVVGSSISLTDAFRRVRIHREEGVRVSVPFTQYLSEQCEQDKEEPRLPQ